MTPFRIVWLATAAYAAIFFMLGLDRYATFHSGADLGIFTQAIANAANGMADTYEHGSHFAFHFSPVLYVLAPLLWLTHSAVALIAVQAVATALIAPALYLIARRRTSERNAAILACIALLYPPLQGVTFTDFHEDGLAPAAVAWLLWAIDARRFAIASLLLLVVLCIKEDQAPAMAFLGIAGLAYFGSSHDELGMTKRGFVFSAFAIVAAVTVFVGYFLLIRPMTGAHGAWIPEHFYAWGAGAPGIPVARQIVGRLTYLLEAFAPLAFIPFRSRVLLLALPGFAEVLASREPLTYTMGQHYAAVWIPYVLAAFVVAGARLLHANSPSGRTWVRASAALCILVSIFFSPLHLGHFLGRPNARDAQIRAAIAQLPRDASIGTYDEIYAHLGLFPRASVGVKTHPQYVLFDTHYASVYWDGTVLPQLKQAREAGLYRLEWQSDGVVLLRR
jgi:uncharacterized membrane protein